MSSHRSGCSKSRRWFCLFTAFLFVFHLHYLRVHLLSETHHVHHPDGSTHMHLVEAPTPVDHRHDEEHGHDGHCHSASDHDVDVLGKRLEPLTGIPDFLASCGQCLPVAPEGLLITAGTECVRPPPDVPIDAGQPRAPPAV